MNETALAYLVSVGIICAGLIWIGAGIGSSTSAFCIALGMVTLAVGLISLSKEFWQRRP